MKLKDLIDIFRPAAALFSANNSAMPQNTAEPDNSVTQQAIPKTAQRRGPRFEAYEIDHPFYGLYPQEILPKLQEYLRSPEQMTRMWGGAFGFSNFIHDFPAFAGACVNLLFDSLRSHHSDEPEAAAHALAYISIACPSALIYIQEAALGRNMFGEDVEKIELYRHFDPEIRRHLACALSSAAIYSKHVADEILDDLLNGFGGYEEEMHCALASELYQIADAHGGNIAWRVYCRLRDRVTQEPFRQARDEIRQHIQGLVRKHPEFYHAYEQPGFDADRGVA